MNYKANTPLRLKMSERCIFMCKSTKLAQCFLDYAIPLNMVKYSCDIISFIQHKLMVTSPWWKNDSNPNNFRRVYVIRFH